jgi:hypothetical protein
MSTDSSPGYQSHDPNPSHPAHNPPVPESSDLSAEHSYMRFCVHCQQDNYDN